MTGRSQPEHVDEQGGGWLLESERLRLRQLDECDAPFILRLYNEPSFHQHIGDKGIRTVDDAARCIEDGPRRSYAHHGLGLYLVACRSTERRIGICGLLRRESLPDVDLGFAFLSEHWGRGYAAEASSTVLDDAEARLQLDRVVAIISPGNERSCRLLFKLGFALEWRFESFENGGPVDVYALALRDAEHRRPDGAMI